MDSPWQLAILNAVEAIDIQETPHGLYGLRQSYSTEGRLPTLAHLFSSPGPTDLLRPCGCQGARSRLGSDEIRFNTSARESVVLQILDHATTKVRQYGSAYRLDKAYHKQANEPAVDFERLLPKLASAEFAGTTRGVLLLAHCASAKEIQEWLSRSIAAEFLARYGLMHDSRQWDDRYGRGFHTSVHLWTNSSKPIPAPAR